MTVAVVASDLRGIGKHMPRRRYQRGTLSTSVPASSTRAERKLPRGTYWSQWYQYVRQPDGSESRRRREKIITRDLAAKYGIARDYDGPLTKTDAQRVLEALIEEESGIYTPPDTEATFEQIAREYITLNETNWGAHTTRTSRNLIETHLIGKLGPRTVAGLNSLELQAFLNGYVNSGASKSLLNKILLYLRAILDLAVVKEIIAANPARNPAHKLKARSRMRPCDRALTVDECQRLLSAVVGRDHLISACSSNSGFDLKSYSACGATTLPQTNSASTRQLWKGRPLL